MTSVSDPINDCVICAKHRGEGPLHGEHVTQTEAFWVFHAPADQEGRAPLGYLFIESDRHVAYLADLTDTEAAALGILRTRLARALMAEADVAFTFAAVIGLGAAHFHEHLIPRYRDAPPDLPWHRSAEAAPRADAETVASLAGRLRLRLSPSS